MRANSVLCVNTLAGAHEGLSPVFAGLTSHTMEARFEGATWHTMLTGAPVLINDPIARHFLEQAQYLGGQMARILAAINKSPKGAAVPGDGLQDAVRQLQSAAAPLLQLLTPGMRNAINGIGQTAEE